jgi:carboxyl-terminal processing protease
VPVLICIFLFIPGTAQGQPTASNSEAYLQCVMDFIQDKYKGEVTNEELQRAAINGMFDSLDPYSDFLTPQEAQSFYAEVEGEFIGIGIEMEKLNDQIMITKVFNPSPAQSAGLIANDIIVRIDGINTIGVTLYEASALLAGEKGTIVTLDILRPSSPQAAMHFEIERAAISINPISYEIHNDIGYIKIDSFNANSAAAFNQALDNMKTNNINKIILDLRGNRGGEVNQAVEIARQLLPAGLITRLDYKSASYEDVGYYSYVNNNNYQLIVLVDELTASAAEIVAGAIQDTKAGILVGAVTYGKSRVQHLLPVLSPAAFEKYRRQLQINTVDAYDLLLMDHNIMLNNDDIIGWAKITTSEYFTPAGRSIDGVGLTPDIVIEKDHDNQHFQYLTKISKLSLSMPLKLNECGRILCRNYPQIIGLSDRIS